MPAVIFLLGYVDILSAETAPSIRGEEELTGFGDEGISLVPFRIDFRPEVNRVLPVTVLPVAVIDIEAAHSVGLVRGKIEPPAVMRQAGHCDIEPLGVEPYLADLSPSFSIRGGVKQSQLVPEG